MPPEPDSSLLHQILRTVARRYRVPAVPFAPAATQAANPAVALAIAIEHARVAAQRAQPPDPALKRAFIDALARLIHQAVHTEHGDPAFQAMLMRHRLPRVHEYASLSAHIAQDRRAVRTAVDAIAHPAKARKHYPDSLAHALARLHAAASQAGWPELAGIARQIRLMPEAANHGSLETGLKALLDDPALERLLRVQALSPDESVRRYQALLDRHTSRAGSPQAAAQGRTTQQRGAAVEALAAQALVTLARRLNKLESRALRTDHAGEFAAPYRVVTSMRVPASIPGNTDRAKTEWDAVLLRQARPMNAGTPEHDTDARSSGHTADAEASWDVCLLVEAKASVDAASTDLPRLLRGLRLLAHAKHDVIYPFATQQGTVNLSGASLQGLNADKDDLAGTVLYCCDAPAETSTRLLSAASRMQLLSASASLAFAGRLAENQSVDPEELEPVWRELLESPRWHAVLHQYATLRLARERMVHPTDLAAAADAWR